MSEFPGWEHSEAFVGAYRRAVRTRSRRHKRGPIFPPVVLRTGPAEGREALDALSAGLRRSATAGGTLPCTPYALVHWPEGTTTELIATIAEQLRENAPTEAGRLRLPTYDLVSSLSEVGDGPPQDRVHAARRGRWNPSRRPETGETGLTVTAFFFTIPASSVMALLDGVHRKWWEARWGARLLWRRRYRHLWPADFDGKRTYGAALREFTRVRKQGTHWDGLLLAALMTDLFGYARQGILHPGRRRRRPRHVLLLNGAADTDGLARPDADGSAAVDAFVSLYNEKQTAGPHPVMVLIAALPPAPGAVPDPGALAKAAGRLNPAKGEIPVRLDVTPPPPADPASRTPVTLIWKPFARLRPVSELIFEATALVAALWLGGQLAFLPLVGRGPIKDAYTGCLSGSESDYVKGSEVKGTAKAQYEGALAMIGEQNKVAGPKPLGEAESKRTVTIAHVRSSLPDNEREGRAGGSIPELRGLAMAQELLHDAAPGDKNDVWVKIRHYDAGVQFARAAEAAELIIKDAKKDPHLIGVVGFTESRTETVAALEKLNAAKIPIVSSTATAKAMEVGRYYHGTAPGNRREAAVVARFIQEANTIRTGEDSSTCTPAQDVAVVTDPTDVYSDELGKDLTARLGWPGDRIGYTPGEENGAAVPNETDLDMSFSMTEVAEAVCGRVGTNPRTLVYWTSRVREFDAFLDAFQNSDCANKDLTVVGGNELTNATFSGNYNEQSWLHLYHTAHMLPYGHPDRSETADEFSEAYRKAFGDNDLWLNDGHAALAHDAVRVLAEAASLASEAGTELTRPTIQDNINNGYFAAEGASGRLEFTQGSLQRPYNKLLVMLHHGADGSAPVLVCGNPGANIEAGLNWRQDDETYDCPGDNDQ